MLHWSKVALLFVVVVSAIAATPVTAQAQSLTVFDLPDASSSAATSINNRGDIAGFFHSSHTRGFLRDRYGNITAFDASRTAVMNIPRRINDFGEIAGNVYESDRNSSRGFVRDRDGIFTVFDAAPTAVITYAEGINDKGDVTGVFSDVDGKDHCYVRNRNGSIIIFDVPNSNLPIVTGINDRGDVVGLFSDTTPAGQTHGFVRDRYGIITIFDAPNAYSMRADSINDFGEVAGLFVDTASQGKTRGYLRDRNGNFSVFDAAPSAIVTNAQSMNKDGDVTGYFFDGHQYRGFVRNRNGDLSVFDVLANSFTFAFSINNQGDVVGYITDSDGNNARGFVRNVR